MKHFTLLYLVLQSQILWSQCLAGITNFPIPWCQDSCSGQLSVFTGGAAPFTFLWSTGDTTQIINNVCPGVYSVTMTDSNGCIRTDTSELEIIGTPLDFEIFISDSFDTPCGNGGTRYFLKVVISGGCNSSGYNFQIDSLDWPTGIPWYCSDTVHNIVVWNCGCYITRDFLIDTLDLWTPPSAIFEAKSIPFTLAPNPARDVLQINFPGIAPSIAAIEVFSISGQFVATYPIENRVLDIQALPSGMYALRIRTHDGRYGYARFVKME
jgi:hypothetical protein